MDVYARNPFSPTGILANHTLLLQVVLVDCEMGGNEEVRFGRVELYGLDYASLGGGERSLRKSFGY